MEDSGVFRTALFGGFNKSDVLKYFDEVQAQFAGRAEDLSAEVAALAGLSDQLQQDRADKERDIEKLAARLTQTQAELEECRQTAAEIQPEAAQSAPAEDESDALRAQLAAVYAENQALRDRLAALEADQDGRAWFMHLSSRIVAAEAQVRAAEALYSREQVRSAALMQILQAVKALDLEAFHAEIKSLQREKDRFEQELTEMAETSGQLGLTIGHIRIRQSAFSLSAQRLESLLAALQDVSEPDAAPGPGDESQPDKPPEMDASSGLDDAPQPHPGVSNN